MIFRKAQHSCTIAILVMAAALSAACNDNLTGPGEGIDPFDDVADASTESENDRVQLKVMTRNLYVGTDVDRLIGITDPNQVPFVVADLWQLLLANDAGDRLAAVARDIAEHQPHVVGLQEVSLFRSQTPADFQLNAQDVVIDFIPTLLGELADLGQSYRVVAQVQNMDVELPRLNSDFTLTDVRVTDFDVILARHDVETANPMSVNYAASWFLAPGVEIPRGAALVDAIVSGQEFRIANTHPEPVETQDGAVQALQAIELLALVAAEDRPTVLMGDLNTEAGTGDTYRMLIDAGFFDVFNARRGAAAPDLTCCHSVDLASDDVPLVKRIDHVMVRNFESLWPSAGTPPVEVHVLGDTPDEKSAGGLWPSDHAGVVATFTLPRPGR